MNKPIDTPTPQKVTGNGRSLSARIRLWCAACAMIMLFTVLTGCASYASADELATVKNQLNEAQRELEALQSSQQITQTEIESLQTENDSMRADIDTLFDENESLRDEISDLRGENESMEADIDDLLDENESVKADINDLTAENESLQSEIDDLHSKNESMQADMDNLSDENESMKTDMDDLIAENESMKAEIETLKQEIQDLQNDNDNDPSTDKIKIYIDQGHNPTSFHNTGASGNGLYEQDLTFTIGILLSQLLEADGRFEVCLSRPTEGTVLGTDTSSSLAARVEGAQAFGADYFISLHINSFTEESPNGIEVLVAEENSISYAFGHHLLQGLLNATGLNNRGMKLRPDLYVLKNATTPAALLEMGFISNTQDAAFLAENQAVFASGIYNGILSYFDLAPLSELEI